MSPIRAANPTMDMRAMAQGMDFHHGSEGAVGADELPAMHWSTVKPLYTTVEDWYPCIDVGPMKSAQ